MEIEDIMKDEKSLEKPRNYSCCGSTPSESAKDDQSIIEDEKIRQKIRQQYANFANQSTSSQTEVVNPGNYTSYTEEDLQKLPEGADLGLGSGNPVALADIREGEVIVDLGSGAGIDCFLASQKTGDSGKVIGIDMTAEMISKARSNARGSGLKNIEFRLGEIEHLPVADSSVDVIISNCVINLSMDKLQVFREAYRILKPGGRLMISDIVLQEEFPEVVKKALADAPGCVSRAWVREDYLTVIEEAGFEAVEMIEAQVIRPQKKIEEQANGTFKGKIISDGQAVEVDLSPDEATRLANTIMKAHIKAIKPLTPSDYENLNY